MPFSINVLGIDPSLNNFAMAHTTVIFDGKNEIISVGGVKLLRTNKKLSDFKRAQIIATEFGYWTTPVDIIVAELPGGSRSARAAWTLGIVTGILASSNKPVVTVTPRQVKSITGKKNASKEWVFNWVDSHFDVQWYADKNGKPYKYNNHVADAIAAVAAGLKNKRKDIVNGTTTA